jgi:hypothetical protein
VPTGTQSWALACEIVFSLGVHSLKDKLIIEEKPEAENFRANIRYSDDKYNYLMKKSFIEDEKWILI